MKASGFSASQRRVVLLLILIVVVVFALLTGFFITSLQSMRSTPLATLPTASQATTTPSPTSPAATSTSIPEEGIWPQVQAARLFDQLARQVEIERALSPHAEVPLSFLDEQEIADMLQVVYEKVDPRATLLPLTALGALPEGPIQIEAQSPAGIYVPEHQQLYVATDRWQDDRDAQLLLAHGYVHALQDQHFDLAATEARARTTDERLAIEALIEGDATLVTGLYASEGPSSADWAGLTDLILEAEHPSYGGSLAGCEAWSKLQSFPNREGRVFASAVFEYGGWDALNDAYTNLPRSTEQILHPSRYLGSASADGEPDEPTTVVVPDLEPVLGEAWRLLVEDTLGEYATGLFLSQVLPEERAEEMANGWDGDTLAVWEREDGRRILVWRTIWSSSADAVDYEEGLRLLVPQRHYPVRPIEAPQGLPGRWWETEEGTINVRRAGRHVLMARTPDTNTAINVLRALP